MLVHPVTGNLRELLDEKGDGHIYRFCMTADDIIGQYHRLVGAGVQPVDENDRPVAEDELEFPHDTRIIWLPKQVGQLSIVGQQVHREESGGRFRIHVTGVPGSRQRAQDVLNERIACGQAGRHRLEIGCRRSQPIGSPLGSSPRNVHLDGLHRREQASRPRTKPAASELAYGSMSKSGEQRVMVTLAG